jgi:hypothetical protein
LRNVEITWKSAVIQQQPLLVQNKAALSKERRTSCGEVTTSEEGSGANLIAASLVFFVT